MVVEQTEQLLKEKKVKKQVFLTELGLSQNTFSNWKRRGTEPSSRIVSKIADYFGVSTDYLLGKETRQYISEQEPAQMFRDVFSKLLQENGVTPYRVAKETGISQGTMGAYFRGEKTPKGENLSKIADYFGVTVDYLLGKEEQKKENTQSVLSEKQKEVLEIMDTLTDEQLQKALDFAQFLRSSNQGKKL